MHSAQSDPSANRAISILEKIKANHNPAMLAYWVTPNTILTLSGARAFCDGVFWSEDSNELNGWGKDIATCLATIKGQQEVVASTSGVQEVREGEACATYELILTEGLHNVLEGTAIINVDSAMLVIPNATPSSIVKWLMKSLANKDEFKDYSEEDLNHVAFGILVGYPDAAILETVNDDWRMKDPFAEPVVNADIRGASYYLCPQPVYDYPRHLINDSKIKAHEKLWSGILKDYYRSDFHKSLEADQSFQQKMSELGNFR